MIPVVQFVAISSFSVAVISTVNPVLQVLGRSRISAGLIILQAVMLLGGLILFHARFETIGDVAMVRLAAATLTMPVALIVIKIILELHFIEMLKVVWRPAVAVSVMIFVLLQVLPQDMELPGPVRLGLRIAAGGFSYAAALMLLWMAAGRPPGAEGAVTRVIVERLKSK